MLGLWDERHGIVPSQCHNTPVGVLRGRLAGQPNVQMDYALSLLTSVVRFMSSLLNSHHLSWPQSYSIVISYSKYCIDSIMPIIKWSCEAISANPQVIWWWWTSSMVWTAAASDGQTLAETTDPSEEYTLDALWKLRERSNDRTVESSVRRMTWKYFTSTAWRFITLTIWRKSDQIMEEESKWRTIQMNQNITWQVDNNKQDWNI